MPYTACIFSSGSPNFTDGVATSMFVCSSLQDGDASSFRSNGSVIVSYIIALGVLLVYKTTFFYFVSYSSLKAVAAMAEKIPLTLVANNWCLFSVLIFFHLLVFFYSGIVW